MTLESEWHFEHMDETSFPFGTPKNPADLLIASSMSSLVGSPPWHPAQEIPFELWTSFLNTAEASSSRISWHVTH
jgi:hypothetical protein